jgi:hypothetical protein
MVQPAPVGVKALSAPAIQRNLTFLPAAVAGSWTVVVMNPPELPVQAGRFESRLVFPSAALKSLKLEPPSTKRAPVGGERHFRGQWRVVLRRHLASATDVALHRQIDTAGLFARHGRRRYCAWGTLACGGALAGGGERPIHFRRTDSVAT